MRVGIALVYLAVLAGFGLFNQAAAQTAAPAPEALLGPGDELSVRVLGDDEIPDKPFRVDAEGFLHLPLAGEIKAAGRTTRAIEADLKEKMKAYVKDPQVTVALLESHSRPVSVLGAVNAPGVHQIEGPKRLLEVLSLAGGLRPDAGSTVRITRQSAFGAIPLANSREDLSGKYSVAEIDLDGLMRGVHPEQNLGIEPQDVVTVTKADLVYVLGEVKKAGGFPLLAHERISVLSALGLAEGMVPDASARGARILRAASDGPNRTAIPVNLSLILQGKSPDVPLEPNDILLVPRDNARLFAARAAETAVALGTGILIWKR